MLRLRAGTATLLIGPRAAAGMHGRRYCLDSDAEIRHRLTIALHDPAGRDALRRFWAHWQGDARLSGIKDHSIIDRIARMGTHGPLIVFLVNDTSVQRRGSATHAKKAAALPRGSTAPKVPAGPIAVRRAVTPSPVVPAAIKAPAAISQPALPTPGNIVSKWSIGEKLLAIVTRTPHSKMLSLDVRQQLLGLFSDKYFVVWLVASLLVWFASHAFVVGEVVDALLVAGLALRAGGIFFALRASYETGHLIGEFIDTTWNAKDEKDLNAAADKLASIIMMIGVTVLIAALTHASTRATSSGLKAKGSIKQAPPERAPTLEKLQERAKPNNSSSEITKKSAAPETAVATPGAVATKPNEACFWSGRSIGPDGVAKGGPGNAAQIAKANGGTTLETLIEERGIKMPDWDPNNPASVKAWADISEAYAQGASGDVKVILGQDLRPGNVWETKELPALTNNPNVKSITAIDPATGASKAIYP